MVIGLLSRLLLVCTRVPSWFMVKDSGLSWAWTCLSLLLVVKKWLSFSNQLCLHAPVQLASSQCICTCRLKSHHPKTALKYDLEKCLIFGCLNFWTVLQWSSYGLLSKVSCIDVSKTRVKSHAGILHVFWCVSVSMSAWMCTRAGAMFVSLGWQ